jgi:predicted XRE-type DNA-binding protein
MPKLRKSGKAHTEPTFEVGCGNTFIDLGFSENRAANLSIRSQLMIVAKLAIKERGWTQEEAARYLSVSQPRISDLFRGHIGKFSVDSLMNLLYKLGKDVTVSVKNRRIA